MYARKSFSYCLFSTVVPQKLWLNVIQYSVKIHEFFGHSDFTWNQLQHNLQILTDLLRDSGMNSSFDVFNSPKLVSRKIWIAEKLLNFHTVHHHHSSPHCGNYGILLPRFFRKIFVKLTFYRRTLLHTVWKSRQKYDHDFYGKMNIFSVKSMQHWTVC